MSKFLGKYKVNYEEIVPEDKYVSNMSKFYTAFNKKDKRECFLKVISKEKLQAEDYIFLQERLNKEQEIQT